MAELVADYVLERLLELAPEAVRDSLAQNRREEAETLERLSELVDALRGELSA